MTSEGAAAQTAEAVLTQNAPRRTGARLVYYLPAVLVLVLGLAAWEGLTRLLDVRAFILPPPSANEDDAAA